MGSYESEGVLLSEDISVSQHRHVAGAVSALGFDNVQVHLNGLVDDSGVVRLTGSSPMSSSIKLRARLSHLAD